MRIPCLTIVILVFLLLSQSVFAGKILFDRSVVGDTGIFMMDENGTNVRTLAKQGWHGAFSPNGKSIAFVSSRDGNCEIYLMDAEGQNQTQLTNTPENDLYPTWSPDGKQLAFMNRGKAGFDIFVIPAEGGESIDLTNSPDDDRFPAWSPDGREIAFVNSSGRIFNEKIYVLSVEDRKGPRKLTRFEDPRIAERGPCWSPDGNWIAFFRGKGIYVIHPDGEGEKELLELPFDPGLGFISWFQPGQFRTVEPEGKATTIWGWLKER